MNCLSPRYYKTSEFKLPCGSCIACRIAKTREWKVRLINELDKTKKGVFITLTFDEEHYQKSIKKRDMQLFLKKVRNYFDDRVIKYYLVGEYGEKTLRPHYHAILFNISMDELKGVKHGRYTASLIISKLWTKGMNVVGACTPQSIQYVTGYIRKKLVGKQSKIYGDNEKPFCLMSKGLGKDWFKKNQSEIENQLEIKLFGKNVGIPRYYKKQLSDEAQKKLVDIAIERDRREREEQINKLLKSESKMLRYANTLSFSYFRDILKQRKKNIQKFLSLYDPKI